MKSEYPKEMYHPNFAPAVLAPAESLVRPRGEGVRDGEYRANRHVGAPARFPPVSVNNADQEEYYASRGYVVGKQQMPLVNQYTHKERENIRMREVPQANDPPPTGEYPKWVGDKIANNAEEEAEILRIIEGRLPTVIPPLPSKEQAAIESMRDAGNRLMSTKNEMYASLAEVDQAELAEFRAWKANRERLQEMARGSEKNERVKRRRKPWTPEQRQRASDNAKARAARKERGPNLAEDF